MTDDPSSPSKKLVRETRTRNLDGIELWPTRNKFLEWEKTRARMHDIRTEFFVRVSRTSFLDGQLGSSVMGLTELDFVAFVFAVVVLVVFKLVVFFCKLCFMASGFVCVLIDCLVAVWLFYCTSTSDSLGTERKTISEMTYCVCSWTHKIMLIYVSTVVAYLLSA